MIITQMTPVDQVPAYWGYAAPKVAEILRNTDSDESDVYNGLMSGHYTLWMVYSDTGMPYGFAVTHPLVRGDEASLVIYIAYSEGGSALRSALRKIEDHAQTIGFSKLIFRTTHDADLFTRYSRPLGFQPRYTEYHREL